LGALSEKLYGNWRNRYPIAVIYTQRRFLPLARLLLITILPWRVDIRFKNPCVLACLMLLG